MCNSPSRAACQAQAWKSRADRTKASMVTSVTIATVEGAPSCRCDKNGKRLKYVHWRDYDCTVATVEGASACRFANGVMDGP